MKRNFFSTVAGATILISVLGIAAKGLGFLREIIYAGYFGLRADFESFLIGYVLPTTINTAVLFLAQNYFIPEFTNYKNNYPKKAALFFNKNIWLFFISGLIISLALYVFADPIINNYIHNADDGARKIALNVFRIFILTIPLNAVFSLIAAYLHTELQFTFPAVAQLLMNVFVIAFVVLFTGVLGIYSIPFGLLLGNFVQLFFLMWVIRNSFSFEFRAIFSGFFSFKSINKSFILIVIIELINQFYVVVDRYFINSVESGGIAALNYSATIFQLPITIFSFALSSAIFPQMAKLYNTGYMEDLRGQYLKALKINSFVFLPIAVILIFAGNVLIRVFFQRGNFTGHDTEITSALLQILAASLVFYSAYAITYKLIFTTGLIKQLLVVTITAMVFKALLNFILVDFYKQNGLAISSALSYIFMCSAGYVIAARKIKFGLTVELLKSMALQFLNSAVSFCIAYLVFSYFLPQNAIGAAAMMALFVVIYTVNAVMLKTEEIDVVKNLIKKNG